MNVPNTLTVLRLLLIFPISILLYKELYLWSLILFGLAGLSDLADGYIARKFNQKTSLGSFLDPATDKVLIFTGNTILALKHVIPLWFYWLVLAKDICLLAGVIILQIKRIEWKPRPNIYGKTSVFFQALIIFLAIIHAGFFQITIPLGVIIIICSAFTVISWILYLSDFSSLVKGKGGKDAC